MYTEYVYGTLAIKIRNSERKKQVEKGGKEAV
jgi:hypothetical protein